MVWVGWSLPMLVEIDGQRRPPETPEGVVVVVCLDADASPVVALQTVASAAANTPGASPIVVVGERAQLDALEEARAADRARIMRLTRGEHETPAGALNRTLGLFGCCDVALLVGGVRVSSGWLEGLKAAAHSDSSVASATPLSLGGGGVEIVSLNAGGAASFDALAAAVRDGAARLWPRIAGVGPASAYLRREAVELAGPIGGEFGLVEALSDFGRRATASGLLHVVADDVLVDGRTLSPPAPNDPVRITIEQDDRSPLRRSRAVAGWTLRPLSVTIDGRALVSAYGGTQTYLLGLIEALTRAGATETRVLTPPDLSARAREAFESHVGLELVSYEEVIAGVPPSDVVHRPQQVFTVDDLNLLRLAGERLVIGQQDLIAYHNPTYHASIDDWRAYRRVTRISLAAADQTVFFSGHARSDALAEDLVEPDRAHVVGIGAEGTSGDQRAPDGLRVEEPFLLCLGADYAHKNRPFAIELQRSLERMGWPGRLVLAGSHVSFGSSAQREREVLAREGEPGTRVVDLGSVAEPERRWLLAHARAMVYPTLYEGFGLIPAEAAAWRLPCLFAAQTSLAELGGDAATLVPWDPQASAAAVLPLLEDSEERTAHLRRLDALAVPSWERVADDLLGVYRRAISSVPSRSAPSAWQELEREREISALSALAQEYQDAYHALERRVGDGLPLIEEGGLLSRLQQRGLMRVASRRGGRAALGPFELLGRLSGPPVGDSDGSQDT